MAKIYATFGEVSGLAKDVEIFISGTTRTELILSGASAVAGTLKSTTPSMTSNRAVVQIWADKPVFVTVGAAPIATMANGAFCPGGGAIFIATKPGDLVSAIDA